MLLHLQLKDFVIVDAAELEFEPGFTVLSGETGAGKSILLDALQLAMGGRAESAVVRAGAARADITAEFAIDAVQSEWLAQRALQGDPGKVLLRRIVENDGRSRAFVNGHPATAALLRELGEQLVDIHGQHQAQSMLRPDAQRTLLDEFGQHGAALTALAQHFDAWRTLQAALQAAEEDSREGALERERLQWKAGELGQLKLAPGEWEKLDLDHRQLAHASALTDGARQAFELLSQDEAAVSGRLHTLLGKLRALAAIDPRLAGCVEMLDSAAIQVDEAASTLSDYADGVDSDPQRLAQLEARMSLVYATARKFKLAPQDIVVELANLNTRLAALEAARDVNALREKVGEAQKTYEQAALALSKKRRAVARKLQEGVTTNIGRLGMEGGRLEVAITQGEPTASGTDRIEFRIAGHAGAPARALAKVASGGELSRIGLAIAVLAAQANPVPTLIFDEADAGVGGAVAEVIGDLMHRLGGARQVFCVTHLPQVAAKAHHHFVVTKLARASDVVSAVTALTGNARVEEIARMLGGIEITGTTRKHARELLAQR